MKQYNTTCASGTPVDMAFSYKLGPAHILSGAAATAVRGRNIFLSVRVNEENAKQTNCNNNQAPDRT
jgi:hypothetical protein